MRWSCKGVQCGGEYQTGLDQLSQSYEVFKTPVNCAMQLRV